MGKGARIGIVHLAFFMHNKIHTQQYTNNIQMHTLDGYVGSEDNVLINIVLMFNKNIVLCSSEKDILVGPGTSLPNEGL